MEPDRIATGEWPEAMERGRVGDAAFAAAYARVSDRRRAWLKTGLAALHAALGGPMPLSRHDGASLGHDLALARFESPLDFAVVICGKEFLSPARLVAAVLPALCARVPDVAAVRVGAAWPRELLTALELCGVETACRVGVRSLSGLWTALAGKGEGAVVLLDGVDAPVKGADGLRLLPARVAGRSGLFAGAGATFDREALAFAHPDMRFFLHGDPGPVSPPFVAAPAYLAEAAGFGYDAVYAAPDGFDAARRAAPLVLGPGRETLWLWPQLPPDAFRRVRLTAAVEDRSGPDR